MKRRTSILTLLGIGLLAGGVLAQDDPSALEVYQQRQLQTDWVTSQLTEGQAGEWTVPQGVWDLQDGRLRMLDGTGRQVWSASPNALPGWTMQGLYGEPTVWMGVTLGSVEADLAAHLPVEADACRIVTDVVAGGPAEKAGLRVHDVLVSIEGSERVGATTLRDALADKKPGDKLALRVLRAGDVRDVEVHLGARKSMPMTAWRQYGVGQDGRVLTWPQQQRYKPAHPMYQKQLEEARKALDAARQSRALRTYLDVYGNKVKGGERPQEEPAEEPEGYEQLSDRVARIEEQVQRISDMLEKALKRDR